MITSGNEKNPKMVQLTLGPLLFNWQPDKIRDFYFKIADEAPIDIVFLGEVVCSKRFVFQSEYFNPVLERLISAKKQVIFSSLALVMDEKECSSIRDLADMADEYLIEANDMSLVGLLKGRSHAIGPFINTYNEDTLTYLESQGARRISLPCELSRESITEIAKAKKDAILEVQVFGRLPLAISARCYHARYHHRSKDTCQFVCNQDRDGKIVKTLEEKPFLTINGTQTLSYTYVNLLSELDALQEIGIESFRLSPHDCDMVFISQVFRDVLDRKISKNEGFQVIQEKCPNIVFCNGFFHNKPGFNQVAN